MVTNHLVIARMNELAAAESTGRAAPMFADEDMAIEAHEEFGAKAVSPATHTPVVANAEAEEHEEELPVRSVSLMPTIAEAYSPEEYDSEEDEEYLPDEEEEEFQDGELPLPVRRSTRVRGGVGTTLPHRYALHTSLKAGLREHGDAAREAVAKEFAQLFNDKKALVPVKRSQLTWQQRKQIIRSSMFLKSKFNAMGAFEKIKARLVADGSMQDRNLYPDNSSPTVAMQSLFMCLGIAARERRHIMQVDITGAYLNADMKGEEMLMQLDETTTSILATSVPEVIPFIENGTLVVRLEKALYGCVQSAKLWYEKLTGVLQDMGFTQNTVDKCVLNMIRNGKQLTLCVYVDDILALSENAEDLKWLEGELKEAFDEIQAEISEDFSYLGMHISMGDRQVNISMKKFVEELLELFGQSKMRATPALGNLFESGEERALSEADRAHFHTMVAKLLYLSKRTRCDIALPVNFLCTRVSCATEGDKSELDRVMGYLKMTKAREMVLTYRGEWSVVGYIDAAFGCHADGKSQSGCLVQVGGATVQAISRKQKIVTKDSTEAELAGGIV
jgi:hypothetical protein